MTESQIRLFRDLAESIDKGASDMAKRLLGMPVQGAPLPIEATSDWIGLRSCFQRGGVSQPPLERALREALLTQIHSFLVALDGGSKLAEQGRLYLTDHHGQFVGDGLHELFFEYLADEDRARL